MNNNNKRTLDIDRKMKAIRRLLVLIGGANREIELSRKMKAPLMVRQAEHLKKQYTKQLLEILDEYKLAVKFLEAA